jgi:hypothetical protein
MSHATTDFVGSTSVLDALLATYTRPFMDYSSGKQVCNVTQSQKDSLAEIERVLDGEAVAMAGGIEAIGHLLAIGDYDGMGLQQSQLANLGWLLVHLGKQMDSHHNIIGFLNFSLSNTVIVK